MKRITLGCVILLLTLGLSIAAGVVMHHIHMPIAASLAEAAQDADSGDWTSARLHAAQAREKWERARHFMAALADHSSMEELDGLFAELEEFAAQEETSDFSAACMHLVRLSDSMRQNHSLLWWNIL